MTIEETKEEMLKFKDFYGFELSRIDEIEQATTKEDLSRILTLHENLLEDMLHDAKSHLDNFKRKCQLTHHYINQ